MLRLANAFLAAAAAGALAALLLLRNYGGIPLPDFADEKLKAAFEEMGYSVKYGALRLGLSGSLDIDSVAVRFAGTPANFFKAAKLRISFLTLPLLRGEFRIRRAEVADGRLGATYADIDSNPVLRDIYACAGNLGGWWKIEALSFRAGNLLVDARGDVNENFDFSKFAQRLAPRAAAPKNAGGVPKKADARSYAELVDSVSAFAPTLAKYSGVFGDPVLDLNFNFDSRGGNRIRAGLRSGTAAFGVSGRNVRARDVFIALRCGSPGGGDEKIEAFFSAKELVSDGFAKLENIAARTEVAAGAENYRFENTGLWAKKIEFGGTVVDNVLVQRDRAGEAPWWGVWKVFAAAGSQRLAADADVLKKGDSFGIRADFMCDADPAEVFRRGEFLGIEELEKFSFPDGVEMRGTLDYDGKTGKVLVRGDVEASSPVVMDIPVKFCRARAYFDGEVFEASDIAVETAEGWKLEGFFTQNLKNMEYSIGVKGNLRPAAISHFMAPWWGRIMSSFSFGEGNFPFGDVRVDGTWGKPEFIWCFARAEGGNASYCGAEFSRFGVDVYASPERISLFNLAVKARDGTADGFVEWLYGKDGITAFEKQRIFLESNLDAGALAALGGDDAREVLDEVRFSKAPRISFNAELCNRRTDPRGRDVFNVTAFGPGRTDVGGVGLWNLGFKAESDGANILVEDASFKFCEGDAKGSVFLTRRPGGGTDFKANLSAVGMDQDEFTAFLASLGGGSAEGGKSGKTAETPAEKGTVEVEASLSGNLNDMARVSGGGYAQVENKGLGKLHLFGMLSRALSALRLPLGSFDITYARSPFGIADGKVDFTMLEIGGPVMRIKGAASYDFVRDNVDAAFLLTPFGGISLPIVDNVVSLINPITNTVQIKVDGPLESPTFGVGLDLSNALKSDEKIIEDMKKSP